MDRHPNTFHQGAFMKLLILLGLISASFASSIASANIVWGTAVRDRHASGNIVWGTAVRDRHASGQSTAAILEAVRDRHASGQSTAVILEAVRDRHASGANATETNAADRTAS